MSDYLRLVVGGKQYRGWKEVHVEKSLEALCGAFEVALYDTSRFDKTLWPIHMGDEFQVYIEDQLVVSGYIEDVNLSYSPTSHEFRIAGRDKLADLVDCHRPCSALWGNQFSGWSVLRLIQKLCEPHHITVVVDASATSLAAEPEYLFGVNEGETVYESIRRVCQKHFIMPTTMGDGKLLLTRIGNTRATDRLESGVNILRGSVKQSNRERYSVYYIKGYGLALETASPDDYVHPKGQAGDPLIRRYRPFVLVDDANITVHDCRKRAVAEAQLRAGRSRVYEFDVAGWTQSDGSLWQINSMVQVKDDVFGLEETLLVDDTRFVLNEQQGEITTIQLVYPDKYKAEAQIGRIKAFSDLAALSGEGTPDTAPTL